MNTYGPDSSPALTRQEGGYPTAWEGRVPSHVRTARVLPGDGRLAPDTEYPVWVGSTGCVIAILDGDRRASLAPGTFTPSQWHQRAVSPMRGRLTP